MCRREAQQGFFAVLQRISQYEDTIQLRRRESASACACERECRCKKIGHESTSGTWQPMTTFGPFGDRSILPAHSICALSGAPFSSTPYLLGQGREITLKAENGSGPFIDNFSTQIFQVSLVFRVPVKVDLVLGFVT